MSTDSQGVPTTSDGRNAPRGGDPAVSVIVPVTERPHDLSLLVEAFSKEFVDSGRPFEFVFAVEPWKRHLLDVLRPLIERGEPIRVLQVGQGVGESALLDVAGSTCTSPILVTLPCYPRVKPGSLVELVATVESGADMASAARMSSKDSLWNRIQNRTFHAILRWTIGTGLKDVASGVRAMKRSILADIPLYGDFFRFLPVLAQREGFQVVEVPVHQHAVDRRTRLYSPGIYVRRLIDMLGLLFLVRFTHKPLRFFGLLGSVFSLAGGVILAVLLVQRLGGRGIADRPMLLLGTLLFVLGVQAVAIGLIGEIIVHLNASRNRLYRLRTEDETEEVAAYGSET